MTFLVLCLFVAWLAATACCVRLTRTLRASTARLNANTVLLAEMTDELNRCTIALHRAGRR